MYQLAPSAITDDRCPTCSFDTYLLQLQKRFQAGKLKGFVAPVKRKYKPTNRKSDRCPAAGHRIDCSKIAPSDSDGDSDDDSADEDEVDIAKRRKAGKPVSTSDQAVRRRRPTQAHFTHAGCHCKQA